MDCVITVRVMLGFGVSVGFVLMRLLRNRNLSKLKVVVVLSGKRKSGKDYVANKLIEVLKNVLSTYVISRF